MDSAGRWARATIKGAKVARKTVGDYFRRIGPFVSIGGVELERLVLLGKCPSAPLGKNDRAVRGDPSRWAHLLRCSAGSSGDARVDCASSVRCGGLGRLNSRRRSNSGCRGRARAATCCLSGSVAVRRCGAWLQRASVVVGWTCAEFLVCIPDPVHPQRD
jgi:hypothetical protein